MSEFNKLYANGSNLKLDFSNGKIMATNNWSTIFSIDVNYSNQKAIVTVESDSSKAERNN